MTITELREKRTKALNAAKAFLDAHRNDMGTLSAEDENHLAAVLVGMQSDRRTRHKASLEHTVCSVKEHIRSKLLLAALEIRHMRKLNFVKLDNHSFYVCVLLEQRY